MGRRAIVSPIAIAPRLRLDLTAADVVAGVAACATAGSAQREERLLLEQWGAGDEGLAFLSVRSAFDVLLDTLRLPAGAEAAFTGVTHPDMVLIARSHGLRVLPLDLDLDTLAPTADSLERGIRPATQLVVVAHLFGGRVDLAPIAERARRHGALVVEDCAQALRGARDHGDALADVSLFSFGSIKTATALGGALACIRPPDLRARVAAAQQARPRQPRREQLAKLAKYAALLALDRPLAYGLLARALSLAGRDLDEFVTSSVKAFPHAGLSGSAEALDAQRATLLERRIRRAPSAPLLALVRRRLRRFDDARLTRRAAFGERAAVALPEHLRLAGRHALERTHWVFPVLAPDPDALIASLRHARVDATRATSGVAAVEAPADEPDLEPRNALALLRHVVFVPVYPELGELGLRRALDALRQTAPPAAVRPPPSERVSAREGARP
jgi:dTDP-4-amino-4,6-dideoxygalactose transaminase